MIFKWVKLNIVSDDYRDYRDYQFFFLVIGSLNIFLVIA